MWLSLFQIAFLAIISPASSFSDEPAPVDYVERGGHSVARLGDFIYIDGGWVAQYDDEQGDQTPLLAVNSTLSIPLGSAWNNASLNMTDIAKAGAPVLIREALWADDVRQLIYVWGGEGVIVPTDDDNTHTWELTVDGTGGGSWKFEDLESSSQVSGLLRASAGAAVSCYNTGFSLGGHAALQDGSDTLVPGLLTYNMTSQSWANESAAPFTTHGTSLGAEAVCLPTFGPNGLVLFMGGITSVGNNWLDPGLPLSQSPGVAFDNLTMYDPFSKQWHWQSTTGDRPTPRHEFCAVGVQGPNSTYEIFVFSGIATQSTNMLGDFYVLTLPGFVWFKGNYTSDVVRGWTRCVAPGDSQMIVVGGYTDPSPDPWLQGLGVFDLISMSPRSSYDPNAGPYDSPGIVKDWYSNGGLNSVSWSSGTVKQLFVTQNGQNTNATSPTSTGSSTPQNSSPIKNTPTSTPSNNNTKIIAGSVVGGVVLLSIVVASIWWFCYRKRNKTHSLISESMPLGSEITKTEPTYHPPAMVYELEQQTSTMELQSHREPVEVEAPTHLR